MTVNPNRVEQIIRAARPLRYTGARNVTMAAPLFIAAMVIIHQHEGERMGYLRFANLMQIGDKAAWMILKALVTHGYVNKTLVPRQTGRGRREGSYTICGSALVTQPETVIPRRTRSAA